MAYTKRKTPAAKSKGGNQATALPEGDVEVDEEHGRLVTWVNEADDATLDTRDMAEKCRAYYDSNQWTNAERAKLKSQKQAATVVNRCKPKADALMGMERANRTTAKAQPRTPKHAGGALAATEAVRFCLQDNMYNEVRSAAWENLVIEGTGGIEVAVKEAKDTAIGFKIVLRHIMWDRLIYDPHSRAKNFTDHPRFKGQVVWMDYDEAVAMYPAGADILEEMQGGSSTYDDKPRWMDNTRRRVKIVELYYRKADGEVWYACFTRGGFLKGPQISPFVNEEGETEDPYEFASLFVDREGCRYGSLRQILDVQDEINKRRSKALHLMSVRQTFGTKGSVEDVNKARAELAKPDGHVEFAYGELNKDFGILPTGDMAQAQFNLLAEAKMEIDTVGANAATMGKDKTVQSGVALRQRALTGQTELAPMFDVLKNLDVRVYRKVWNRIRQYWKAEMWIRVTDDENNLKFVGLNKPVTRGEKALTDAQAAGAKPQELEQLAAQIAQDPMAKQIVETANDIVNLDVDIVMDDAPDTVTQEVEDFQAMAEMVKSGFPIPPEAVIMASPLSNKDKILKMMKEQPQVPPEMQEKMQQQGEELQKLAQENQALKQDQQSEMAKLQVKQQSDMQELAHKRQLAELELQLEREKAAAEIQLAREKAEADIALKRAVAVAELEIEQMRLGMEKEKTEATLGQEERRMAFDQSQAAKADSEKARAETGKENEKKATDLNPKILATLEKVVESAKPQKKRISITMPDGRKATADVEAG